MIHGVGIAKASGIIGVFTLARRLEKQKALDKFQIKEPESVANYLRPFLAGKNQEEFHVILLDTKNYVIQKIMVSRGLLDRSYVHPREVFRQAVKIGTSKIILAHNHPSGDPTPSTRDIESTKQLIEAGDVLGITVMDHIILGSQTTCSSVSFVSMRSLGYFPE